MSEPLRSCAVIGHAVDVWPVAVTLAAQLPQTVRITVVETSGRSDEERVFPLADPLLADLDVTPGDLVAAGAKLTLGQALEGFLGDDSRLIAANSGDLPAIGGLPLHQILHCVAERAGALARFAEVHAGFRLGARAAQAGRMALPEDAPDSPLTMLAPLVRIEGSALADLFRRRIDPERVDQVRSARVVLHHASCGSIGSVSLEDGRNLTADLLVDLRSNALETGAAATVDMPVLDAAAKLGMAVSRGPHDMPAYKANGGDGQSGIRRYLAIPWQGNHLRLGPASARYGPLFGLGAPLLFAQIRALAGCLPASASMPIEARRFNQLHGRLAERFHEIAAAPFHLNRRPEPAWQALRDIAPPEGLALRIDRFAARGDLPELDAEVVDRQFWIDLLIGFGVVPRRHDRRADGYDPRQLDAALGTVRKQIDEALAAMPTQPEFLQRFQPA